jgi:hypothetical protein
MKSYKDSIEGLRTEIRLIKKHLKLLKEYPPTSIYLLDKDHLVIPRQYRVYGDSWRNKITLNIIASNIWTVPDKYDMLLGQLYAPRKASLIPVKIKDLALYVHFKYKTTLFEKIIKTGKLPRR